MSEDVECLRILFITDIHCNEDVLFENMSIKQLQDHKVDVVLLGGDFQRYGRADSDNEVAILDNMNYVAHIRDGLYKELGVPVYFVLGNHDLQKHTALVPPKVQLRAGLYLVTQSGSSSTLPTHLPFDKLSHSITFWDGVPYGPRYERTAAYEEMESFQGGHREQVSREIADMVQDQFLSVDCAQVSYNGGQSFEGEVRDDEQYVVLSHQGPYCSSTSCDVYQGSYGGFLPAEFHDKVLMFSSGSPQNQQFYELHQGQIVLWVHGHSHHPRLPRCRQIVNPGRFPAYSIIGLRKREGRWEMVTTDFHKLGG